MDTEWDNTNAQFAHNWLVGVHGSSSKLRLPNDSNYRPYAKEIGAMILRNPSLEMYLELDLKFAIEISLLVVILVWVHMG